MNVLDSYKSKWQYFVDIQVWPLRVKFDPIGWIDNFDASDRPLAAVLADRFLFYRTPMVEHVFSTAFQRLSKHVLNVDRTDHSGFVNAWRAWIQNVIIVRVEGEIPSDADSGFLFSRMARDVLRIDEDAILSPEEAVKELSNSNPNATIIFVDDFVGSGQQFITCWNRLHEPLADQRSFANLSKGSRANRQYIYLPVFCTEYGLGEIMKYCNNVFVSPGHLIPNKNGVLHPDGAFWEDHDASKGRELVHRISTDLKIPGWTGFHDLGLSIAFDHGWPDANLPLFSWSGSGWTPLLRK